MFARARWAVLLAEGTVWRWWMQWYRPRWKGERWKSYRHAMRREFLQWLEGLPPDWPANYGDTDGSNGRQTRGQASELTQ